jgi:hypothetical protein
LRWRSGAVGKDGAAFSTQEIFKQIAAGNYAQQSTADALDRAMMERCIALAIQAVDVGEYPYAAVMSTAKSFPRASTRRVRIATSRYAEIVVMKQL